MGLHPAPILSPLALCSGFPAPWLCFRLSLILLLPALSDSTVARPTALALAGKWLHCSFTYSLPLPSTLLCRATDHASLLLRPPTKLLFTSLALCCFYLSVGLSLPCFCYSIQRYTASFLSLHPKL